MPISSWATAISTLISAPISALISMPRSTPMSTSMGISAPMSLASISAISNAGMSSIPAMSDISPSIGPISAGAMSSWSISSKPISEALVPISSLGVGSSGGLVAAAAARTPSGIVARMSAPVLRIITRTSRFSACARSISVGISGKCTTACALFARFVSTIPEKVANLAIAHFPSRSI